KLAIFKRRMALRPPPHHFQDSVAYDSALLQALQGSQSPPPSCLSAAIPNPESQAQPGRGHPRDDYPRGFHGSLFLTGTWKRRSVAKRELSTGHFVSSDYGRGPCWGTRSKCKWFVHFLYGMYILCTDERIL